MTGEKQAKTYAEGKAQEALTAVVEKAFADGYNAGYKDAIAELKVAPDVEESGVKFVDFDLPSGTLWASDYVRDKDGKPICLEYDKAAPLGLPRKEQLEELLRLCDVKLNTTVPKGPMGEIFYDVSRNGKRITLSSLHFWIFTRPDYNPNTEIKQVAYNLKVTDCAKSCLYMVRIVKKRG